MLVLRCRPAPFFCFELSTEVCILGRSARCDIVVNHSSISRRHAEFRLGDSGYWVRDLDSLNGTFVDEQRIEASAVLVGQAVRFGSVTFVISTEESADNDLPSEEATDHCDEPVGVSVPGSFNMNALSGAERRVFRYLLTGQPEKSIAKRLDLSRHTVHNHIRAIFEAYGVHSRAELFAKLLREKDPPAGPNPPSPNPS